jgi:hypothetical protein
MALPAWEFAVMDGEQLVEVTDTAAEAADIAGIPKVKSNPYYGITPGNIRDLDELTDTMEKGGSAKGAFKASGIPQQVSGHEVLELTDGLKNPKRVFERLEQYFKHVPHFDRKGTWKGANWESPRSMVNSFLGENEKTKSPRKGVPDSIRGLALVPFWRNTQCETVKENEGKDEFFFRNIEKNFPIDLKGLSKEDRRQYESHNWCVGSSWACRVSCLVRTGNNVTQENAVSKYAKSAALLGDPVAFCAALAMNCKSFADGQASVGKKATIRLNMLADVPWEVVFPDLFEMVPHARYYDYTKVGIHNRNIPSNYDLTFSFNGENEELCKMALEAKHRIAVVMVSPDATRKPSVKDQRVTYEEAIEVFGREMKNPFGAKGTYQFVDGNSDDFRPMDPAPSIVFLSYKAPKGVDEVDQEQIRYRSGFAIPVGHERDPSKRGPSPEYVDRNLLRLLPKQNPSRPRLNVIPVRRFGDALIAAHTPYQGPFTVDDLVDVEE